MDHREGHAGLNPDWADSSPRAGSSGSSSPGHGGGRHRYEDRQPGDPVYRPSLPGRGREATDTDQWEFDPDEWDTGEWQRGTDTGEWELGDLAALDPTGDTRRPRHLRPEGFWEGIRLAGDDPRWMPTPASAPRSPELPYPVADPTGPRADDRPAGRGVPRTVCYTAGWYVVPVLVLFGWVLTRDNSVPAGCVTDAAGRGCESERAEAVASAAAALPRLGVALGVSVVAALVLRRVGRGWRTASVGLVAALIGGGVTSAVLHLTSG